MAQEWTWSTAERLVAGGVRLSPELLGISNNQGRSVKGLMYWNKGAAWVKRSQSVQNNRRMTRGYNAGLLRNTSWAIEINGSGWSDRRSRANRNDSRKKRADDENAIRLFVGNSKERRA